MGKLSWKPCCLTTIATTTRPHHHSPRRKYYLRIPSNNAKPHDTTTFPPPYLRHTCHYGPSFAKATGRSVSKADLANEDRGEGEEEEESASQSTPKRKGKAKRAARVSAQEKLVGVGVRKFFPRYKEEFDGEVGWLCLAFGWCGREARLGLFGERGRVFGVPLPPAAFLAGE